MKVWKACITILAGMFIILFSVNVYAEETGDTLLLPDTESSAVIEPAGATVPSDSSISADDGSTFSLDSGVAAAATSGSESGSEGDPSYKPGGSGGSSNSGGPDKSMPDLFTGTMSHSIPIEVPAGRNGMAPNLNLLYRSSNGNGWLGVGWELEVGSIERSAKGGVNYDDFQETFLLRMPGGISELFDVSGNGTEYRAKIEGAFNRIRKLTAADGRPYWEVTDKNGTRYSYGLSRDSRQDDPLDPNTPNDIEDPNKIFKWCLDRVDDVNGNYMTFSYYKNQVESTGQIYLDHIDYTGNGSLMPTNYVKFYRESRTDAPDMYTTNFRVKTTYRLKTIEVKGNGFPVRAYKLSYSTSGSTSKSLLASVQQYGDDFTLDESPQNFGTVTGGTALPEVSADYNSEILSFSSSFSGPTRGVDDTIDGATIDISRVMTGDFNGDGKTDIAAMEGWGNSRAMSIYLSLGNGSFTGANPGPIRWVGSDYNSARIDISRIRMGDFNGDGKTDIAAVEGWGNSRAMSIYLSLGNGSFTGAYPGPTRGVDDTIDGATIDISRVMTGDFDGDGKTDIAAVEGWGNSRAMNIYLSLGNGSFTGAYPGPIRWVGSDYNSARIEISRIRMGDFNGDGKTDIAAVEGWGNSRAMSIYLSNGDGSFTGAYPGPTRWVNNTIDGATIDISRVMTGDFNGDGKTDIAAVEGWGNSRAMSIYLSLGNGSFTGAYPGPIRWVGSDYNSARIDISRIGMGDFNGDGKTDIAAVEGWGNSRAMSIYLSLGNGSFTGAYPGPVRWVGSDYNSARIDISRIRMGDFNGDGPLDIAAVRGWGGSAPMAIYRSGSVPPNLLNTISNNFGATTTIAYKPSTQYANTQLPFPIQTVSSVTTTTKDANGSDISSTTNYTYSGGFFHIGEKDFRGFNYVKVTGQAGPNGEQTITETWFHQGDDVAVDANNIIDANGIDIPTVGYMKGKPYRVKVKDGSGNVYSESTTSYTADSAAPYFNPSLEVNTSICDGDACGKQTKVVYDMYDAYGNVLQISNYGDVSDTSDDSTAVKSYGYNTTAWIVGLPTNEAVYEGIGTAGAKKSETFYYYDGTDTCNTPSTNQNPDKGKLTRVKRWLKNDQTEGYVDALMAYNSYGNLTCGRDANGNPTSVTYDATYTFPKTVTNALGHQATTQYYGVDGVVADKGLYGQVKSVTDPNGATVTNEYDTFGRKTKTTMPDGSWATISYPGISDPSNTYGKIDGTASAQHITTNTSAGLSSWTYFDGLGRTIIAKGTGPDGKVIAGRTLYDARGAVRQSSLPYFDGIDTPKYTTFTHDPVGRTVSALMPDGTSSQACYNDGVSVFIDANSHRKRETRDANGRLKQVDEYTGTFTTCNTDTGTPYATTTYQYDTLGNLRYVTDANGNQTEMRYDTLGRKTYMHDPDMGNWNYYYDNNGNLTSQADTMGQWIYFQYDALNRLRQKDYTTQKPLGSGNVVYNYDENTSYGIGHLTSMTDYTGSATYYYDSMGQATRADKVVSGSTYTTRYTYDQVGRPYTVTYPDSAVVTYEYNGPMLNRAYEGTTSYVQYAGYNALGQPTTVSNGNGVTTGYTYYPDNFRLNTINTTKDSSTYQSKQYSYDNIGNVSAFYDTINGDQGFGYDELGRLTSVTSGAYGAVAYAYDKIGNMTTNTQVGTYTYPTNGIRPHAVTTAGTNAYDYDNNGNMTTGAGRTITYDPENRPITITKDGITTTFDYDGNGERVRKTANGVTTVYIGKLYECINGACEKYIFANGQRIAKKTVGTGETYYYHSDHLGSSSVVTDSSGNQVENLAYYPYGASRIDSAPGMSHHKYTDQELDDSTGLYNYNARLYDPVLGRFISADSIVPDPSDPQSFNRYSYVLNNPIRYTDPTGHLSWDDVEDAWEDTKDWVSDNSEAVGFALQNTGFGLIPGTYMLTQSEQGRNILAGEIMVGTAAATFACGGCGAGVGALAGEAVGGYSAHQAGGDILSGVVVGGVLGGATGYMAGGISTETGSFWAQAGKNFAAGAIKGAGIGASAGYMGGRGNANTMLRGAAIGAAVMGSLQASKVLIFGRNVTYEMDVQDALMRGEQLTGADFSGVTAREGGLLQYLRPGTQGITLGNMINANAGTYTSLATSEYQTFMMHELTHVLQYSHYGFVPFLARYLTYSVTYGYWNNPLEVGARDAAGGY